MYSQSDRENLLKEKHEIETNEAWDLQFDILSNRIVILTEVLQ